MTDLEPGWLEREFQNIAALERARKKILAAEKTARANGQTQPISVEFTRAELREMAVAVRVAF